MKDHRNMLRELFRATQIVGPVAYRWFGAICTTASVKSAAALSPSDARSTLLYGLKHRLYADFYCPGGARAADESGFIQGPASMTPFLHALSEANAGRGSAESGWRLVRIEGKHCVVERGGITLWAFPDQLVGCGDSGKSDDAILALRLPKELLRLSPGFYMALGEREWSQDNEHPEVRYYWNLDVRAAVDIMRLVTVRFNQEQIPFRFKVIADELCYRRTDAGVLYVLRDHMDAARTLVDDIYTSTASLLKPRTPAFTKELAPGLAFAESPTNPLESFGTSRCDALADYLIRAHEAGKDDVEDRLDFVERCFVEQGLSLDAPHLNPPVQAIQ